MADIFQEVDEELRKDRYQVWLRKYGPWVLGAAIVIIAVVGGWQFWESWSESRRNTASDTYNSAAQLVEGERWDEAGVALDDISENGPDGYATLALMQRGAVALEAGDNEAARGFFERAAARSPDPLVRDLATLKAALAGYESYSADDLANRLGRIAGGDNAMRHLASELIAAKAMDEADYETARSEYESIVFALDAPDGVRARASAALAVLNRVAPETADDADVAEATGPEAGDGDEAVVEPVLGGGDAAVIEVPEATVSGADNLAPGSEDDDTATDDETPGETGEDEE